MIEASPEKEVSASMSFYHIEYGSDDHEQLMPLVRDEPGRRISFTSPVDPKYVSSPMALIYPSCSLSATHITAVTFSMRLQANAFAPVNRVSTLRKL